MSQLKPDSAPTHALLERVGAGDREALDQLLDRHRPALHEFVAARWGADLRARLDPSDLVQEAHLEMARRMDDFLRRRPMPFHVWMRKTAYKRLLNAQRDHRLAARRAVAREAPWPERSSLPLGRSPPRATSSHGPCWFHWPCLASRP